MGGVKMLLLNYALNAAWQAPLVTAAAWLAARLLRREGPAVAHNLWFAALVLDTALPASGSVTAWVRSALEAMRADARTGSGLVTVHTGVAWTRGSLAMSGWAIDAACVGIVAVTAYFTLRLLWSIAGTRRLLREARPPAEGDMVRARCEALALRLRVDPPELACSDAIAGPVILGLFRPILLAPAGFLELLTPEDADAALAHELAHVRRRDFARHLAAQVLALPLRWNPVTRLTLTRLEETREAACDAMAAGVLDGSRSYARSLLQLASLIQQRGSAATPHALGLFEGRTLERRLMQLTQPTVRLSRLQRMAATGAALVLTLGVCGSASALRVGVSAPAPQEAVADGAQKPLMVGSGIMAGQIVSKVTPVYPADAKAAKIEGAVVLKAVIGKDGAVKNLAVVSGPKELLPSSIDAVRQWVYKPYLLNGNAVEVETTITVHYMLAK